MYLSFEVVFELFGEFLLPSIKFPFRTCPLNMLEFRYSCNLFSLEFQRIFASLQLETVTESKKLFTSRSFLEKQVLRSFFWCFATISDVLFEFSRLYKSFEYFSGISNVLLESLNVFWCFFRIFEALQQFWIFFQEFLTFCWNF